MLYLLGGDGGFGKSFEWKMIKGLLVFFKKKNFTDCVI